MKNICLSLPGIFFCLLSAAQSQLEPVFDRGVTLLQQMKYADANQVFSRVISSATDKKLKKFSYIYRAYSFNGLMELNAAVKDLDTAFILDPHDYGTLIDRGTAKGMMKDYAGATKDFNTVVDNEKDSTLKTKAFYWLGLIAFNQNHFPQAIALYTKCIALNSTNAEFYFNRGAAKGMLIPADLRGSIEDYDQAIRLRPGYAAAYANRGVAKINQYTTKGVIHPSTEQTVEACTDLNMAKSLGDSSVDDMMFVYCGKR
jgi:tetratricopeptide (TPR) repeat protein